MGEDGAAEALQITESSGERLVHDPQIHVLVLVDEHIAKTGHVRPAFRSLLRHHAQPCEGDEDLTVRVGYRLARSDEQPAADVEAGFDGLLQGALHGEVKHLVLLEAFQGDALEPAQERTPFVQVLKFAGNGLIGVHEKNACMASRWRR